MIWVSGVEGAEGVEFYKNCYLLGKCSFNKINRIIIDFPENYSDHLVVGIHFMKNR